MIKRIRGEAECAKLENLDLSNGFISPFCLHMIAKSIQYNNTQNNINGALFDINLSRNILCGVNSAGDGDYDPTGLIELLETLAPSRCLRTLTLERNYIGVDACKALGTLLETRNPLSQLNLKACSLTSQEIIEIVSKMKKNTHLQILNLGSNFLNANSLEKLGKSITEKRCVLHYIDLSNNNLGDAEAEALILFIKENHSLLTLILDDNSFEEKGMKHIGTMLSRAKNLESISLHNNHIGHSGTREIALALEKNTKLTYLGLQWNNITNSCIELLAKALMQNRALKNITLIGNDFDDSKAALLLEGSLVANTNHVNIDVPHAPIRPPAIALKDLEAVEYFPFLNAFNGT